MNGSLDIMPNLSDYQTNNPDGLTEREHDILFLVMFHDLLQNDDGYSVAKIMGKQNAFWIRNEVGQLSDYELELGRILISDFIDYYQIFKTHSKVVYEYTKKYFPKDQYKRILCVGDGMRCHLGRKLAADGYDVMCVDPISKKEMERRYDKGNYGRLSVYNSSDGSVGFFNRRSPLIQYNDVIIGSKIPDIAEEVIRAGKPCLFTTSMNPGTNSEISMFGEKITNYMQMDSILRTAPGVRTEKIPGTSGMNMYIRGGKTIDKTKREEEEL